MIKSKINGQFLQDIVSKMDEQKVLSDDHHLQVDQACGEALGGNLDAIPRLLKLIELEVSVSENEG